ncbi:hypothetical protein R7D97_16435 [Vibrio sp. Vb5031]|nr:MULTISPECIES: hypothetical protein [Vibrio]MCA2421851.1 hypothetical protein [Vibrio alginolyticus]MCA2446541.1 hypothetical protein [Vibrio alginolyticus]MCR9821587.1 hypothetical protein [Vibrio parahaemolyticus]MDF5108330.1 hypothetical protein [Vibrio parahaemolyticus]MDF5143236.1 hypothetical protein [Vibrio parahaemolyticus]
MRFLLTVGVSFVGGVYFTLANPSLGRTITSYADIVIAQASALLGG